MRKSLRLSHRWIVDFLALNTIRKRRFKLYFRFPPAIEKDHLYLFPAVTATT